MYDYLLKLVISRVSLLPTRYVRTCVATFVESARSLMDAKGLPLKLLSDAVNYTDNLKNCILHTNQSITPFEQWFGFTEKILISSDVRIDELFVSVSSSSDYFNISSQNISKTYFNKEF